MASRGWHGLCASCAGALALCDAGHSGKYLRVTVERRGLVGHGCCSIVHFYRTVIGIFNAIRSIEVLHYIDYSLTGWLNKLLGGANGKDYYGSA